MSKVIEYAQGNFKGLDELTEEEYQREIRTAEHIGESEKDYYVLCQRIPMVYDNQKTSKEKLPVKDTIILKVGGYTVPGKLADAAYGYIKDGHKVVMDAVGAASVYVATKAMVLLNGKLAERGSRALYVPHYRDSVNDDGEARTIIRWQIIIQQ
jgi:stage V sporulation protein SpoVS